MIDCQNYLYSEDESFCSVFLFFNNMELQSEVDQNCYFRAHHHNLNCLAILANKLTSMY